jgi:nucleoid-associated protein YgaU
MNRILPVIALLLLTGCASVPPEPEINPLPPGHPMAQAAPEPGKVWAKPVQRADASARVEPIGQRERERASEQVYTVQQGDTLWRISKRFGMTVADLMRLNHLTDSDVRNLRVGQILKVQ